MSWIVEPWRADPVALIWMMVMGALVASTCGVLGCWLNLRRNALMGDAISHAVLPGIVLAALLMGRSHGPHVVIGALLAALVCVALVHALYVSVRIREEAAIGIAFTTLFAVGVILISLFSRHIDLDADCVLHGELEYVPLEPLVQVAGVGLAPASVLLMGFVALLTLGGGWLFRKHLLLSSFDPGLAASTGIRPIAVHYALMGMTALAAVSSFQAVGAILVVAVFVVPGATAMLLTRRLRTMLVICGLLGAVYAVAGVHVALWWGVSTAAAMVVVAFVLFLAAWVLAPRYGLLASQVWDRRAVEPPVHPAA